MRYACCEELSWNVLHAHPWSHFFTLSAASYQPYLNHCSTVAQCLCAAHEVHLTLLPLSGMCDASQPRSLTDLFERYDCGG